MRDPERLDEESPDGRSAITRRDFFLKIGNTAVGATLLGGCVVSARFLWPNVVLEPSARFSACSLQELVPGSVIFNPRHRVFTFREKEGYLYSVSGVCTHLGCTTNWQPDGVPGHPEGILACPCHGSVFAKKGDVIRGPALRSLDRFRTTLEEGELYVDTGEKVDEDGMILRV